jgi:hypothetical protein
MPSPAAVSCSEERIMPISPNQGSAGGGTTVTITGVNLAGATSVTFGGSPATITSNTPTMVSVTSPAGNGPVDVSVTTRGGTSNTLSYFNLPAPVVTGCDTTAGSTAGGNTVTITGLYLSTASTVNFGGNSATPTVINDGKLSVVVPAGSPGGVAITVTTAGGSTASLPYSYVDAPTIVAIDPTSGATTGGTAVSITGTNLGHTEAVSFDGVAANFLPISSTSVVALAPPGTAGAVDVVVVTAGGSATAAGGYTYVNSPGI